MPAKLKCKQCGYQADLGPYHFHDFSDGHVGARLLMCSSCGAQHHVLIALRPESIRAMNRGRDRYRVILTAAGPSPVAVMAELRKAIKGSLAETKAKLDTLPLCLGEDLTVEQAQAIADRFEAVGATVSTIVFPNRQSFLNQRVTLVSAGDSPARVMAALRKLLDCSLKEALQAVRAVPYSFGTVSPQTASEIQRALQEAGGRIDSTDVSARDQLQVLVDRGGDQQWEDCAILGERKDPNGEFDLKLQRCGHCQALGCLVSEGGSAATCPKCRSAPLEQISFWVT